MATYHFSMKTGGKGEAAAHACYISRAGEYADRPDLEYAESGNMPELASSDRDFWSAADEFERANGTTYREIELALPRELDPERRRELVLGFVEKHIGDHHPYTLAIHNPKAAIEGGEQPHVHIQFCERKLDGIKRGWEQFFKRANRQEPERGGCAKDERWNGKDRAEHLEELRGAWEEQVNRAYQLAQRPERVSCRSLEAQGVEREPERHLGPKMVRDQNTVNLVRELREYQREKALIEWDRSVLAAEFERERSQELSLSASPQAKVHSPPLPGEDSPSQQPVFASYEEAVKYQGGYIEARGAVIQEFFRKPLERKQAEKLLEVDKTRKELEKATKERERIEKSWLKIGLTKSKDIEQQAKKAFWKANLEHRELEAQLLQRYPGEWARENSERIEREMEKRLGVGCGKRFEKAIEMLAKQEKQQVQQRLELVRLQGEGRKGPDMGR